jgi:hypothetical protein
MENKVNNLVKNVLEENIVQFKENASKELYKKLGDRLKNEYANVAKNVFKKTN